MELESGAAKIDSGDEGWAGVEAEGAVAEEADLVVHAFEPGVGEPGADHLEDAIEVLAYGAGEGDEGAQSGAAGPGDPRLELGPGLLGAGTGEQVEEALLSR